MYYQVIETTALDKLKAEVNEALQAGWVPAGGVCVVYSPASSNWYFYQAITRQGEGGVTGSQEG